MQLNHVALLVPSALRAAEVLRPMGFSIGPAERFEGEGTLEIYVGDNDTQCATLLLMEPMNDGPYARAMRKRGPGLHHIAIELPDLDAALERAADAGWLLHPHSLKSVSRGGPAYLARPGVPALIEIQKRPLVPALPPFIESIQLPRTDDPRLGMFRALGLENVEYSTVPDLILRIAQREIRASELL